MSESILLFSMAIVGLIIGLSGSTEAGVMAGAFIFGIWYRTKRG